MESIMAYKNQHGQQGSGKKITTLKLSLPFAIMQKILDCLIFTPIKPYTGTQEESDTQVSANDMCALDEWPSHARRNRAQLQNGTHFGLYLCPSFIQSNTE
jgi:hypothetical protein